MLTVVVGVDVVVDVSVVVVVGVVVVAVNGVDCFVDVLSTSFVISADADANIDVGDTNAEYSSIDIAAIDVSGKPSFGASDLDGIIVAWFGIVVSISGKLFSSLDSVALANNSCAIKVSLSNQSFKSHCETYVLLRCLLAKNVVLMKRSFYFDLRIFGAVVRRKDRNNFCKFNWVSYCCGVIPSWQASFESAAFDYISSTFLNC